MGTPIIAVACGIRRSTASRSKPGRKISLLASPQGAEAARLVPEIDKVAARHPGLRIVMDHLGLNSKQRDAEAFADFFVRQTFRQKLKHLRLAIGKCLE